MAPTTWPDWLNRQGPLGLPSGREVLVGAREETWVTVELDGGVRVTIDDDGPGGLLVGLHRARTPHDGPPATRPYGVEAAIRYDPGTGRLEIAEPPFTAHSRDCEGCDVYRHAGFSGWFDASLIPALLDVFAALPVDREPRDMPDEGIAVWRGRLDESGAALIEQLSADGEPWEGEQAVAARVDLGLAPLASPPRWAFRAFLDPGAGLLWSADTATEQEFDYAVEHDELPIGRDLVDRIDAMLDRYARSIPVTGEQQPFSADEWDVFRQQYRDVLRDLRAELGSAFTIRDDEFGGE